MSQSLRYIKRKQKENFTGHLHFERFILYIDNGMLCTAESDEDRFWILRRLLCSGYIEDEYARELQEVEENLNLYLFPNLPEAEWMRILKDRSRQNLSLILGIQQEPIATQCFIDRLPFLHEVNVDKLDHLRRIIAPLQERIAHIWIKSKAENDTMKANAMPLAVLVAQSPWEEIDTLQSVFDLIESNNLDWGENIAELDGGIMEEEELLFGYEPEKGDRHFVVPKELLDRVELKKQKEKP